MLSTYSVLQARGVCKHRRRTGSGEPYGKPVCVRAQRDSRAFGGLSCTLKALDAWNPTSSLCIVRLSGPAELHVRSCSQEVLPLALQHHQIPKSSQQERVKSKKPDESNLLYMSLAHRLHKSLICQESNLLTMNKPFPQLQTT